MSPAIIEKVLSLGITFLSSGYEGRVVGWGFATFSTQVLGARSIHTLHVPRDLLEIERAKGGRSNKARDYK